MFADLVRQSVQDERVRRDFDNLRGSVGVVADDSGSALTLRFDFGRLTVHEGLVGIPTVTARGTTEDIEALADLPLGGGISGLADRDGRQALAAVASALRKRRLKIYGLLLHARLVFRLLSVLSRRKSPNGSGFDGRSGRR